MTPSYEIVERYSMTGKPDGDWDTSVAVTNTDGSPLVYTTQLKAQEVADAWNRCADKFTFYAVRQRA